MYRGDTQSLEGSDAAGSPRLKNDLVCRTNWQNIEAMRYSNQGSLHQVRWHERLNQRAAEVPGAGLPRRFALGRSAEVKN
jgi:hypothetical protein